MTPTRWRWLELTALVLVLAVRVAALAAYEATPRAAHPMVDAHTFWSQAEALLAGKDPFAEGYYQPPAYPFFLEGVGRMLGELTLPGVRRVQLLLGMLTIGGILVLARRLGRALDLPWAGLVAVLAYGLYRPLIQFEQDVLTPTLTASLLVGALCVEVWRGPARAAVGGLAMGLATAVHPTYLLASLWLGGWSSWRAPKRALVAGAFTVGLAAPLVPTALGNHQDFGTLTLVSHNAGINFYLGNSADWKQTSFLPAGLAFRQVALESEPHRRDVSERNRYWRARTWDEIGQDPGRWLGALATKALWSVSDTEIPRNEDYRCQLRSGEATGWLRYLPVRYGILFPLGLAGVLLLRTRARSEALLLGGAWVALHAPMVLFLVADRYRVAALPVIALLAPLGIELVRRERRLGVLAGLVVAAVLCWLPLDARTALDPARCAYFDGHMAMMDDQPHRARTSYSEVLEVRPDDMGAHWWLAQIDARADDYRSAASHMDVVLRQFPDHFPTLKAAAGYHRKLGDVDREIALLRRAYAVPGDRTSTGARLVKALVRVGLRDEARALVAADEKLSRHRSVVELGL